LNNQIGSYFAYENTAGQPASPGGLSEFARVPSDTVSGFWTCRRDPPIEEHNSESTGSAWAELYRVVDRARVRNGRKYLWRTEIQFSNGESAWLIPSKIRNYGEVVALVGRLPCERTEVTA
jgi:hypothetical protein